MTDEKGGRITAKERARLRSLAQKLKPVLHIGREGITSGTLHALDESFRSRELLKLKVQRGAPVSASEAAELLAGQVSGVHVIQIIGRTVILFRPDPETEGSLDSLFGEGSF